MKYFFYAAALTLVSCGGNLSDEQRRQIREGMEMQKIVKINDSEIIGEALGKGQAVYAEMEKSQFRLDIDSLAATNKVVIRLVTPGSTTGRIVEQELIEAYVNGIEGSTTPENIQKLWTSEKKEDYDSVLYTRPQIVRRADGVDELKGIWSIYMSRKDVVLSISRNK